MKLRALALLLVLPIVGCCGSPLLPSEAYTQADRETYEAITPYLDQFGNEHPEEKPFVDAAVRSWDSRLSAAESRYDAIRQQESK